MDGYNEKSGNGNLVVSRFLVFSFLVLRAFSAGGSLYIGGGFKCIFKYIINFSVHY